MLVISTNYFRRINTKKRVNSLIKVVPTSLFQIILLSDLGRGGRHTLFFPRKILLFLQKEKKSSHFFDKIRRHSQTIPFPSELTDCESAVRKICQLKMLEKYYKLYI